MPEPIRFVGIDVAMAKLDVHVQPSGETFAVANTAAGVNRLATRIGPEAPMIIRVALEASGGYERTAAEGLAEAGLSVFCLHPADVRAFARMAGKRAKTDRIDAALIARAAPIAMASRQALSRQASRRRHQGNGRLPPAALEPARRPPGPDHPARDRGPIHDQAGRILLAQQIATLQSDIARIDDAIAATIASHPDLCATARRIQTAPGAGPVLAATLIAYLPELGTLTSRQAASLTGVAPHPRQSGNRRAQGRCQAGRAPVRTVLYMATLAAIRSKSSHLRAFFERLKANGKPFKLAMVAAMRKFVVMLNAMIQQGRDWNPQLA